MRMSTEQTLAPWPTESTHGLGGVAEIVHQVQAEPGLSGQSLLQGKGVVLGILMRKGLKLTTPFVARMRLKPRATRFKREERGVEHTRRSQHVL